MAYAVDLPIRELRVSAFLTGRRAVGLVTAARVEAAVSVERMAEGTLGHVEVLLRNALATRMTVRQAQRRQTMSWVGDRTVGLDQRGATMSPLPSASCRQAGASVGIPFRRAASAKRSSYVTSPSKSSPRSRAAAR